MTADAKAESFTGVLRNRQFFALWIAQFVSSFGDWLAIMALFDRVAFRAQGTAYEVAGIMIAFIAPLAFVGPVAGVFVDRWDVKKTMIASDLIRAGIAVAFVFATAQYQVYILMAAMSAVSCFFMPAQSVAIPLIVRKEQLLIANALNAQTMQLNKVISPAIAGLLVTWAGEKACFYIDAFTFIFSAAALSTLALSRAGAEQDKGAGSMLKELTEGLKFIINHRAVSFVVVSMIAAVFAIGAFDALISIYIRDILLAQAALFGYLVSLVGVGTILGALLIGRFGQRHSKVFMVVAGILMMGASVFFIAVFNGVGAVLVSSLVLGLGVGYVLVPSQTLIQEESPQAILGRVSSTSFSLITVAQFLSIVVAGTIAGRIGIINLYYVVAAMLALIALFGFAYAKRKIKSA